LENHALYHPYELEIFVLFDQDFYVMYEEISSSDLYVVLDFLVVLHLKEILFFYHCSYLPLNQGALEHLDLILKQVFAVNLSVQEEVKF
jgi:hypothetical protein